MAVGSLVSGPSAGGSFWNDQRFRGIVAQAFVMGLLGLLLYFVISNTIYNLEQRNIATGFWFMTQPAGFEIQMTLIPYSAESTHGRVFLVGLLNTLFISVIGCVFASVLGFVLGVLRLSGNWLLGNIIYWYVEFTRNVPLLLQIIFWYTVFLPCQVDFLDRWRAMHQPSLEPVARRHLHPVTLAVGDHRIPDRLVARIAPITHGKELAVTAASIEDDMRMRVIAIRMHPGNVLVPHIA